MLMAVGVRIDAKQIIVIACLWSKVRMDKGDKGTVIIACTHEDCQEFCQVMLKCQEE
jgi:hypothetical protein